MRHVRCIQSRVFMWELTYVLVLVYSLSMFIHFFAFFSYVPFFNYSFIF